MVEAGMEVDVFCLAEGDNEPLQQVIDGERRPGHLVTSPRWEWLPADDGVRVEEGLDVGRLAGAAGRVVPTTWLGLPSAQQVVAVPVPGEAIVGAADPRTVGAALGV